MYPAGMERIREHDTATAAPGDLELVQRFMNLHEHAPGSRIEIPASAQTLRSFLVGRGLLPEEERFDESDRETALELLEALHARVRANEGEPLSKDHVATIDELAQAAGLHPHFEPGGPVIVPSERGLAGALGRLVAIAFHAELDGRWSHLKECADENCRSVFFDASKNHSGRWCSMQACGNRNKVRAWRERRKVP